MTSPLHVSRHEVEAPIYGAGKRRAARARERAAERRDARRRGDAAPPGVIYMERIVPLPVDVMLVFDAGGWHAEAIPHDELDIEALCDAQDLEDAAWFAKHRPACVEPAARLRAPVKRCRRQARGRRGRIRR